MVAWARVLLATATAGYGAFVPGDRPHRTLYLMVGLLYVPWAAVVLLASDEPNRLAVVGGPASDALLLAAVQIFLPSVGGDVVVAYALIAAFAAYSWTDAAIWLVGVGVLAFFMSVQLLLPVPERLDAGTIGLVCALTAALLVLVDRVTGLQRRATARTRAVEGRSEAILAKVADAVVVTSSVGQICQWNASAERLLGASARPAVGDQCADVFGLQIGDQPLDCSTGCALLRLQAGTDAGVEVCRVAHDGRLQPLFANAAVASGTDGGDEEVVHSLRDITRLKQADEAKNLFLATASHELKTPLTVIFGFSQTLLTADRLTGEEQQQAIVAIHRRAAELVRIVDRLLLSSRIEAGRIDVAISEVALADVLAERVEALTAATGRALVLDIDRPLPLVWVDPHGIVTVVDHLLDNALKYSPDGGPVSVTVRADGHLVHLGVTDSGVGMDAEQVTRCFDKFWQADSTDARRFGGTGIGLYIVKSLVDAMGGRLEVQSQPGHGTTFTLTLQRADVALADDVAAALPDQRAGERSIVHEFMRQLGIPVGRS